MRVGIDGELMASVLFRGKFEARVTLLSRQFRAIGHMLSVEFISHRFLVQGHFVTYRLLVHWEFIEVFICAMMLMLEVVMEYILWGHHADLITR